MKKLLLFTFLAFVMTVKTTAQVPREMQYSLMVTSPVTGQVLTNKNVNLRLELRHGSDKGTTVWAQTYETKTDMTGYCQLTLSFPDTINWGQGSYYMALLVDGKEAGAPKLTVVPYSLCAATIEGVITREELVGTWVGTHQYPDWVYTTNITFNSDGTGFTNYYSFKWGLNNVGNLAIYDRSDQNYPRTNPIYKLSSNMIIIGSNEVIYTKQ